jgi:multiple sugar transport system substrate-binding protein
MVTTNDRKGAITHMKRISLLLVLALIATLVGAVPALADEPVKIVFQSWDPISKYQPVLDAYHARQDKVVVEYQQVSDYLTTIFTEAAGGELPDLIACQVGYTQQFADAGILLELSEADLSADAGFNFADFWETTLDYARYNGKLYGLPVDGGNYAWVYNVKMFEEAGITVPEDGFSWDELVEAAQKLVVRDEAGKVTRYATMMNDLGLKTFLPFIWQNGAEYLSADGKECLINQAAAVEAIQFVKDLYAKYEVMPPLEKLNEGTLPIVGALNAGEIAMGRVALWESLSLDNDAIDWEIMPSPRGKAGHGEVLYVNTLSVSASSGHQAEALDFLKFICSEEGERIFLENTSDPQIACRKALKDVAIAPLPEGVDALVYMDALDYCKWMPNILTVTVQLDAVTRELDRIWYSGEDVQTVLDDAKTAADALL